MLLINLDVHVGEQKEDEDFVVDEQFDRPKYAAQTGGGYRAGIIAPDGSSILFRPKISKTKAPYYFSIRNGALDP